MQAYIERIEPRMLLLLMAGSGLLLTVLLVFLLVVPQLREYQSIDNTHVLLTNVANNGEALTAAFETAKTDVESLSHELHGELAELPVKQLESYIIGKLQKISWQTDVELVSVKPGKGDTVQNFREILFEVQMAGTYFDFFNWLKTVGEDLGFVVIKKFDISPRSGNETQPELVVRLTMVSYRAES